MAKSRSIPILAVLLWHHFCYYKRHKVTLMFTILLPFLLMGMLDLLILTKVSLESLKPCVPDAEALLTSGPLALATSAACSHTECLNTDKNVDDNHIKMQKSERPHKMPAGYSGDILGDMCKKRYRTILECLNNTESRSKSEVVYCNVATSKIIYYPKSSSSVHEIMNILASNLKIHLDFICESYKNRRRNTTFIRNNVKESLPFIVDQIPIIAYGKHTHLQYCLNSKSIQDRLIGVDNYNEAINYARKRLRRMTDSYLDLLNTEMPVPRLWAIVGFKSFEKSTATNQQSRNIEYDIVTDIETPDTISKTSQLSLQSLVEEAIILQQTNVTLNRLREPFIRRLPSKCWNLPASENYKAWGPILALIITFGFLLCPINALDQLVTEKLLRLREYLSTMGVSGAQIRLSWWMFYMLFLVPTSIAFSVLVRYTPKGIFANTSITVLILLLILYNTSQLSQSFFLASVMTTTKRTAMLQVFFSVIFYLLCLILFLSLDSLKGTYLYAAYALSLIHGTIPMTIACIYIASWEKIWLGTHFYNIHLSSSLLDEYGGIGIAMVFLFANSVIYMLLAWYIDCVFPGEYGLRQRPWFFLMPCYWISSLNYSKQTVTSYDNIVSTHDEDAINSFNPNTAGIQINNLCKIYNNGTVAVNNISSQFKKYEITAVLGQNGAGKSTLINCLVGILHPTKGSIFIDGESLIIHRKRHIIGYVPQHDILYPSLTLNEHINFYGALKGHKFSEAQSLVASDIKNMDLGRVRTVIASQLSGGQKRKLSILTAYLGNPSVVVLDEPTSGIDPFSRRAIWKLLLQNRIDITTLLSTHSMQEADMLGDRIAIISSGRLISYGTPSYLKNTYSCGVRLRIALRSVNAGIIEKISNILQTTGLCNVSMEKNVGNDVTFLIPLSESRRRTFAIFLTEFEAKQSELDYESYGVSESSMEDVFFISTEIHRKENADLHETLHNSSLGEGSLNKGNKHHVTGRHLAESETNLNNGTLNNHLLTDLIIYTENVSKWSSYLEVTGLFEKRLMITIRSLHAIIRQMLVPLCFIGLSLIITANHRKDSNSSMSVHLWNQYSTNILFYFTSGAETSAGVNRIVKTLKETGPGTQCVNMQESYKRFPCSNDNSDDLPKDNPSKDIRKKSCSCDGYCNNAIARSFTYDHTKSNDIVFNLSSQPAGYPIEQWIVEVNNSRFIVVGGYQFHRIDDKSWQDLNRTLHTNFYETVEKITRKSRVIIWSKPGMEHAMLNGFNNLQLRSIRNFESYSIQLNLKQIKINSTFSVEKNKVIEGLYLVVSCAFIIFGVFFSTFSIGIHIMSEKENGMKRFQRLYGVTALTDWFTNFITDLFFYIISIGMIGLLLYAAPNSFEDKVGEFLFLMAPYGLMVIWHFYMVSFWFDTLAALTKFYIISSLTLTVVAGILCFIKIAEIVASISDDGFSNFKWAKYLTLILAILPQFYLPESLLFLAALSLIKEHGPKVFENMFEFDALGQYMMISLLSSVIYMGTTFLFEHLNIDCDKLCCCLCGTISSKKANQEHNLQIPNIAYALELTNDVKNEEQKVISQPKGEDPLEVRLLKKTYPNASIPSVDGVTFSVPKKQCFGLLGVNGAGKTTIFRILTGFLKPSSGTTVINGSDLHNAKTLTANALSYCPQDNMLFDDLSVFQHLKFFAKLRNVPSGSRKELINAIMEDLDLIKYAKTKSSNLSGGNKRKLQLAISIIGYPSLIFLDEPTTGMDPGARRRAWRIIESAIERGCSVILTTHSMEECEALCHRLTIMVRGKLMCLGSIQSLKNKFGNRYTVILRLSKYCPGDRSNCSMGNRETVANDTPLTDEHTMNMIQLKQIVAEQCPTAILVEEQLMLLNYEVSVNDIRLSQLYNLIFELKDRLPGVIEDFTVSQLSLEQVFANLVQMYESITPVDQSKVVLNANMPIAVDAKHQPYSDYEQRCRIDPQRNLQPNSGKTENLTSPNISQPVGKIQMQPNIRSKSAQPSSESYSNSTERNNHHIPR